MALAKLRLASGTSRLHTTAGAVKRWLRRASTSPDATASQGGKVDAMFEYTSGRWIYNEPLRRRERDLKFDVGALRRAIASSDSCADVISLEKFAEGGFNRILQATCRNGRRALARLPLPVHGTEALHRCKRSRDDGIPTIESNTGPESVWVVFDSV
ncbi:hypothetical protein H2204_013256 [Knufia peltigerae]|uniref:Uncharacterized protein n=1 Tax=Knufia peltigerae TaxID=1002370 RepID=A0AA38XRV9_9EURO|nr:hypothetical protein H2204_013256 [Knufia peltigerae]